MEQPSSPDSARSYSSLKNRLPAGPRFWILLVVAVLAAVWIGRWVHHRSTHIFSEDASVDGEVIVIASRVSGWVVDLPIIEGDAVKQGQVLARIDARDSRLQLKGLEARLAALDDQTALVKAQITQVDEETLGQVQQESSSVTAAEAALAAMGPELDQAKDDYQRARELAAAKWISPQGLSRAHATYLTAQENYRKFRAGVAVAKGSLAVAGGKRKQLRVLQGQLAVLAKQRDELHTQIQRQHADLNDRDITAPAGGMIVKTFANKGEYVFAGQRLALFHDPDKIWIAANVKETDIADVELGQKADVVVDAYPGRKFTAIVYRVGRTATSKFALLPDPNPSGNFTKVTQRLPVRLLFEQKDVLLRPGMMVEVDIDIRKR
ncbi:MAG: HlyD family secretion protein [Betaproteobacteria bacterium]|nr:MAG: HlyD family secretion protein [Betaproteobacteria bacterium]